MAGKLTVYYGCMFAGKTSALIQHLSELNFKQSEFVVIKPAVDVRSGAATITTHDGKSHECLIYDQGFELGEFITPFTRLIAIDEAQFFDKVFLSDLKRFLGRGVHVVASGLDKDYLGRTFGLMPALIELAEEKHHLKAKCAQCGSDAEYTYRKTENKVLILIGQSQHYEPRCSSCYHQN
jgi:thymidine kinase